MTLSENVRSNMTLRRVVAEVISENPQMTAAYKKGGPYLGFLVGRAMKKDKTLVAYEVQAELRRQINR